MQVIIAEAWKGVPGSKASLAAGGRRQRLAGDTNGQREVRRFVAPCGIAHQIDADGVVAIGRQNA